jgi:hypothetical protein
MRSGDALDVNEVLRRNQPLPHENQQGLTSADNLAVILVRGEQIKRFLDLGGSKVIEILYHPYLLSIRSST